MASLSQDLKVQECALQTPERGHVAAGKTTAVQKPCTTTLSASILKADGRNLLSVSDAKKSYWLSPASTVSPASSPADFNDIWDPPETPTKQTSKATTLGLLTPLTPPTPPSSSRKLDLTPIPKPFFGIKASPVPKQQLLQENDVAPQEDLFQPQKFLRGFTFKLEAISQQSAAAPCVKYNINPSFNFASGANGSVSSRTRSKTGGKGPVTSAIYIARSQGQDSVKAPEHRSNPPLQSKLWKLLDQIIPHDLHARLVSEPRTCVASLVTDPSRRCSAMAKPQGLLDDVSGAAKNLARCKVREDNRGMISHIEKIVQSVMCKRHQNTVLQEYKAGSRLAQLCSQVEDITRMTKADHSTLTQWVNTISDPDAPVDTNPQLSTIAINPKRATQPKSGSKTMSKASTAETTIRISLSSNFTLYQPKKTENLSVSSALYDKAVSSLGAKDLDPGFVYLFWDKEYFGKVKIGYTNNLAQRLKRWNRECKREHDYHSITENQVEMPHVHRVEQLIHTELKECRLRRKCDGCGKLHKEWFEANQVHVVKVMKKWREWILQKPYVQDKESGEWVIRPEMLDSLENMCEPLPQDVSTKEHRKSSGGVRHSSQNKKKGPRRTM